MRVRTATDFRSHNFPFTRKKKMQTKFLRLNQVQDRTGLPRSTIYAYVVDGTFPTPINIGERSVAWLETDIEQWMSEKIISANHTKWSARHD